MHRGTPQYMERGAPAVGVALLVAQLALVANLHQRSLLGINHPNITPPAPRHTQQECMPCAAGHTVAP